MEMTRRFFAGLLGSAGAAMSASKDFTAHRILRRPYRQQQDIPAKPRMLMDALFLSVDSQGQPLRITVQQEGSPEPALQATVTPRPREMVMLLGVHNMRAESTTTITVESRQKFQIFEFAARFMHPPFRRIDGMIHYHDPFYPPHPEDPDFGQAKGFHHRKVFGPGKDVGYV